MMLATDRELVRACHAMFSEMAWLAEPDNEHEMLMLLRSSSWPEAIGLMIKIGMAKPAGFRWEP